MSTANSDNKPADKPAYDKGDRAAVAGGRSGIGVRGQVFWVGENKYGPGFRYGLRGDDGKTYWLDAHEIGPEGEAPETPSKPTFDGQAFDKGDRVTIVDSPTGKGVSGAVFWSGESRYSNAPRYGVKGDDEETYWVDHHQVVAATGEAAAAPQGRAAANAERPEHRAAGNSPYDAGPYDDGPFNARAGEDGPSEPPPFQSGPIADEDLPPEAFMDEQPLNDFNDMPPDEDIPF